MWNACPYCFSHSSLGFNKEKRKGNNSQRGMLG